ncbi:MAG: GNAT family N-acetyltransferase [Alphaproteobacteria bacterium]|nr:GNAT family N-acetyltransferase [Alphaproteobacteria bacterium]
MNALIRPMRIQDIETVRAIERASATRFQGTALAAIADDEPTDARTLEARIRTDDALVCVDDTDTPIAFVIARPLGADIYVEQIDVSPEHGGKRLGAALLAAMAARGPALALSTFRDIPWNAPWYRRLGFVDIADDALPPLLRHIHAEHIERGLDESLRVFMHRAPGPMPQV